MTAFDLAVAFSLGSEGGYSNKANDRGGSTQDGITQASYDIYTKASVATHPVTEISETIARQYYKTMTWGPAGCDKLSVAMSIIQFDWAVNHGPAGACRSLQTCLGIVADGQIGPGTLAAIAQKTDADMIVSYLDYRRCWYEKFVEKDITQEEFLKGWLGRVDRLQTYVTPYVVTA